MPTVADVVVSALHSAGVHTLFGVPGGGSNLDLIAAAGRIGLPFVLTATETAAALSAIAQAEISGRPGACLTTLGPGAASVVNGVACALLDRAPLVVFTDSHPAASAFEHQRLDQAAMLAPITKSSTTLTADHAASLVECALRLATAHPAGPVHLECPGEVASSMERVSSAPLSAGDSTPPASSAAASVATLLARARKPLMLVGLGARRHEHVAAIRRLCERRRVPAMVTYKAKGVVPDGHPWFAGVFTNAVIERAAIDECDVLIGIGLDPVELLPRRWTYEQPIVNFNPWTVEDRQVPFAAQTITDITAAIDALEGILTESGWEVECVHHIVAEQRRQVSIPAGGLAAYRVVEIAAARLASRVAHVTVDAGAHMLPATMLWPVSEPNHLLISNGLSTMGFALPAAIGAALLDRTRPVAALTGDGGLLMCLGELLTAVRQNLPIITIVFSDASLSLIEIKQRARQLPAAGVSLGAIDWPALGSSFGLAAWSASDEAELERSLRQALACDGPSLIEARIDKSNYGATLRAVRGG